MTTPLTLTHLRFDLTATSPIKLDVHQAGERLRDALARVMLRATCAETPRASRPTPEHAAVCPACWLLAAEVEPGEVRRAYCLAPPHPPLDLVAPGERFAFVLTLLGSGFRHLPYFVLAVPEMGRIGIGPGRGQFALHSILALNPLREQSEAVLAQGEQVVRVPENNLDWGSIQDALQPLSQHIQGNGNNLTLQFLTPTRLVESKSLVKSPDFGVFFRRLLERIDQLSQQHAGQDRRPKAEVERLYRLADQVRLVESNVEWVDIWGPSKRKRRSTPMGGFVGMATYRARDWDALLPWVVMGQGVQAGKLAVKGNGVYQIQMPAGRGYWDRIHRQKAGEPMSNKVDL